MDRKSDSFLQLPIAVVGRIDVGRLVREMEGLEAFLQQAVIREPGTSVKLPKTSKLLDDMIEINKLNVLHPADRVRLSDYLKMVYKQAPTIHMSFSADPSVLFQQRLMTWLRQEIHPMVLVQLGLQPNIGAGCVMRTTNKYFDMSLRSRFSDSRELLMAALQGVTTEPAPATPATPTVAVPGAVT